MRHDVLSGMTSLCGGKSNRGRCGGVPRSGGDGGLDMGGCFYNRLLRCARNDAAHTGVESAIRGIPPPLYVLPHRGQRNNKIIVRR